MYEILPLKKYNFEDCSYHSDSVWKEKIWVYFEEKWLDFFLEK